MNAYQMENPEAFDTEREDEQRLMADEQGLEPEGYNFVREQRDGDDDPFRDEEDDCPLDGDLDSALGSAGMGTDEYYNGGCFPEDPWE